MAAIGDLHLVAVILVFLGKIGTDTAGASGAADGIYEQNSHRKDS
jgi:hypothetical protein